MEEFENKETQQEEQKVDSQPAGEVCAQCGAPLTADQAFCPKCGTPRQQKKINICAKCGAELSEGQEFCSKCGQKVGLAVDNNVASAINQFNAGVDKQNEKKKKTPVIIGVVIVIVVLLAVAAKVVGPKIFVSVDDLCAQGNYEKAYAKASGDEKNEVLAASMIADLSEQSSDNLKDPGSFVLRDAYFETFINDDGNVGMEAVLYVSGNNSYGAAVSSYWLWVYDADEKEWEIWGTCDSLNLDSDDDDYLVSSIAKLVVNGDNTIEVGKDQIKYINTMFEEDTLYEALLVDYDSIDTSTIPADEEE